MDDLFPRSVSPTHETLTVFFETICKSKDSKRIIRPDRIKTSANSPRTYQELLDQTSNYAQRSNGDGQFGTWSLHLFKDRPSYVSEAQHACCAYHLDDQYQAAKRLLTKFDLVPVTFPCWNGFVPTVTISFKTNEAIGYDGRERQWTRIFKNAKEDKSLIEMEKLWQHFSNIYIQIPLLMLDPTPNRIKLRTSKFGETAKIIRMPEHNRYDFVIQTKIPGYVMYHPALYWLALGLTREALFLWKILTPNAIQSLVKRNEYYDEDSFSKVSTTKLQNLSNAFLKLLSYKEAKNIVNYRNLKGAIETFVKMKSILIQSSQENYTSGTVWHGSLQKPKSLKSIEFFERIIASGGSLSIGRNYLENWSLKYKGTFVTHASTLVAWESFVNARRPKIDNDIKAEDRLLCFEEKINLLKSIGTATSPTKKYAILKKEW